MISLFSHEPRDTVVMTLGEAIKAARKKRGMSQLALGKHFGVTKVAVGAWEKGKNHPDHEKMPELVRLLELDPALALGLEQKSMPKNEEPTIVTTQIDTSAGVLIPLWEITSPGGVGHEGGGEVLHLTRSVDNWVTAPQALRLVQNSFALRAWDDKNAPWVRQGATLFIDPTQKGRNGDWCIFMAEANLEAGRVVNPLIGVLLGSRKGRSWTMRQAAGLLHLPMATWPLTWLIEWIKP